MDLPDQRLVRAFEEMALLAGADNNYRALRRYLENWSNDLPDPRESAHGRMELRHTATCAAYAGSSDFVFYMIDKWGVFVNLCPADEAFWEQYKLERTNIDQIADVPDSPLVAAVYSHREDLALRLVRTFPEQELDLNRRLNETNGASILHYCAMKGFGDLTELLIERGATIFESDDGYNPLTLAVSNYQAGVVRVLLKECRRQGSLEEAFMDQYTETGARAPLMYFLGSISEKMEDLDGTARQRLVETARVLVKESSESAKVLWSDRHCYR
jgi:hypothetical protein